MPNRTITAAGATWEVFPAGRVTQSDRDEFALVFRRAGDGGAHEMRITRYSPAGARARAASFAELSADDLARYFAESQPADTSPEAGYAR